MKKRLDGKELILGMRNAVAHARGLKAARRETVVKVEVPDLVNVRAIRGKLGMSQAAFAARFGFSIKYVRNWEQGERQPQGLARAYLVVIDRDPQAVQRALAKAS